MNYARYCPHNWTILLQALAQDALQRSDLSNEIYCEILSDQVNSIIERFPPSDRKQAISIAIEYGYTDNQTRNNTNLVQT